MVVTAILMQVDGRAISALERIAFAQTVMAVVMLIIGVLALGAGVVAILELRSARRMMRGMADTMNDLKPRLAPLLDRAKHVTDDLSGMSDNVRRKVDDLLHTAETLNRSIERGSVATEERLRRFSAVLDIVQTEAENLLLDAAAAAHGMQETARVLRERPGGPRRRPAAVRHVDHEVEHEEEEA